MTIVTIPVLIIFLSLIFIMPVMSSHFRNDKSLIQIYWVVILLYQIVAFTNAYWFRTIGADMDAHSFHQIGVELSKGSGSILTSDASLYMNILGWIYSFTSPSLIIGEQLSILLIGLSIIFFVKVLDLLNLNKYQNPTVFLFAALPTMVMLGSITLREPLEIFLLITAVYFGLKMRIYPNKKILNFCFLLLFCFLMGLFAKVLFLFGAIMITVFLIWNVNKTQSVFIINKYRLLILATTPLFVALLFYLAINSDGVSGTELFHLVLSLDLFEAMANHRTYTPIGRASYGILLDTSSLIAFIYSSFLIYVHYLSAPFIWQVSSWIDLYAFLEGLLHVILLYYSIKLWRLEKGVVRQALGMMLMLFFILSLMYAYSSTNYGTGIRHKMLTWWMLALMGGPLFYQRIRQFLNL